MTSTFSLVESESPRCFHLPDSATSNLGSTWSCHSNEWYFLFPPLCVVVFNAQSAKAVQRAPPCAFTATECYTLLSSSQGRVVTSYDPLRWLPVSSSCSTQSQNRKQWHFTALISVPAPPSLCPPPLSLSLPSLVPPLVSSRSRSLLLAQPIATPLSLHVSVIRLPLYTLGSTKRLHAAVISKLISYYRSWQ